MEFIPSLSHEQFNTLNLNNAFLPFLPLWKFSNVGENETSFDLQVDRNALLIDGGVGMNNLLLGPVVQNPIKLILS